MTRTERPVARVLARTGRKPHGPELRSRHRGRRRGLRLGRPPSEDRQREDDQADAGQEQRDPTTMLKTESISDMKPMLSAVVRAVSVTQMFRAPFETGWPFASFAASASSLVPA